MRRDDILRSWCQAACDVVTPGEAEKVPLFAPACQAYRLWCALGGDRLPARQHLDPIILGAGLLPKLSIIEAVDEATDYRWVLVGEDVAGAVGTRLKGKYLSQIEEKLGEIVFFRKLLDRVTREKAPLFYALRHRTTDGSRRRSHGCLLPLRDLRDGDKSPVVVAAILSVGDATTGA